MTGRQGLPRRTGCRLAGSMSDSDGTSTYPSTDLDLDLRWWAAANYLTVGQIYLQGQRAPARTARDGARQAAAARPLGHQPRTLDDLRPAQPAHQRAPARTGSTSPGRGTADPHSSRPHSSRAPTPRSTRTSPTTPTASCTLFRQFSSPGGMPSHVSVQTPGQHPRGRRARVRAGARRRVRRSTTRTSSSPASSGDGEAETGPLAGVVEAARTSSTRAATARCCRSCTSTATRSPAPPCFGRTSDEDAVAYLREPGLGPGVVAGDDPQQVFPTCWAALRSAATSRSWRSARGAPGAASRASRSGTGGRPSCCAPPRAGPGRTTSTASRSRTPTSATRSRCRGSSGEPGAPARCSRSGCRRTGPTIPVRRRAAGSPRSCGRWLRRATSGCRHAVTPTAVGCSRSCRCQRPADGYALDVDGGVTTPREHRDRWAS